MEEEQLKASEEAVAGTSPQFGHEVVMLDSTNAAILIGAAPSNRNPTAAFMTADPILFRNWLTSERGRVPEPNIRLVNGASSDDSGSMPRREEIRIAFESLIDGRVGFDEQGTPLRNRLYVYAVGRGFRVPTGKIILFAVEGENYDRIGVNLTDLVERVRETGTFKEVIFIADVTVDTSVPPIPTEINLPRSSKALPPVVPFYYLACLRTGRARFDESFAGPLLQALDQAAPYVEGHVLSLALVQDLARSMSAAGFGEATLRLATAQGESSYSISIALSDEQAKTISPRQERRGARVVVDREASDDEVCLNADDYAAAVASLFLAGKSGEFCFALYGPWGRGKSFLMKKIAALLSRQDSGYKAIRFSAWKYPTAPEVWVHLYEEFAKSAFGGSWFESLPIVVRTGISKYGVTGLLLAYLMFAFSIFPITNMAHYATYLYPTIGLMGFVWIAGFWFSITRTNERLSKTYLSATRHSEKLGLQATIGTDLAALLKGWIPARGFGIGVFLAYWGITCLLIFATWTRLSDGKAVEEWLSGHHLELIVRSKPAAILGAAMILFLAACLLAVRLNSYRTSPKRILLIVDDLDRCSPHHLLSVMESIKLLVEDPEISARVQVAMLIEEDILKHAIIEKYRALIDTSAGSLPGPKQNIQILIRENCEKLFVAHLRLPRLSSAEIYDLVGAFAGRRKRLTDQMRVLAEQKRQVEIAYTQKPADKIQYKLEEKKVMAGPVVRGEQIGTHKVSDRTRPKYREQTPEEKAAEQLAIEGAIAKATEEMREISRKEQAIQRLLGGVGQVGRVVDAMPLDDAVALGELETDAILAALRGNPESRKNLGPRSVRSLLFQYQLARLLLIRLDIPWGEDDLANELVRTSIARIDSPTVKPILDEMSDTEKLNRVVEQVC